MASDAPSLQSTLKSESTTSGPRKASTLLSTFLLSLYVCSLILVAFLVTTEAANHWFVIPLLACGALIGVDGFRVLRGQTDIFKPVGFVGVLGIHFFFLAPLIHVRWDFWLQYIDTTQVDWRYWLGRMAILNLIGIAAYLLVRELILNLRTTPRREGRYWAIDDQRFRVLSAASLLITGALQVLVFIQFGGISGFMRATEATNEVSMEGYGIIFMVSESFPIIAMLAFVVWASKSPSRQKWLVLILALMVFTALRFVFGGLRGSRGNIIWALFWATAMIHLWIRPIPKKLVYAGAVLVIVLMYLYGFYKTLGSETFSTFQQQGNLAALEQQTGRTFEGVILGDLARADVQAFLLYRLSPGPEGIDYEYAKGATYLGAFTLLIPDVILDTDFPTKVTAGTDAIYGQGASDDRRSSRAYGIAGEAMLNFGVLAVPVAYAVFGVIVAVAQRWMDGLQDRDSRLLIAPLVTIYAFYFLVWDSDNLIVLFFKLGFIPILVLLLSSRTVMRLGSPNNDKPELL